MTLQGFIATHATEEQCLSALISKRWPQGWSCPHCGGSTHYQLKLPLPKIFVAIALMSDKQGISAEALRKAIGCAYDTAFTLLRRLRRAMTERDQRYLLMGGGGGGRCLCRWPWGWPASALAEPGTASA